MLFTSAMTVPDAQSRERQVFSRISHFGALWRLFTQCIAFYEKFLVRRDSISNPVRHLRLTEAKG
jgi:hypothetical protein